MFSQQKSQKEQIFLGIISPVLGLLPIAIAAEIVEVDPATVHAPPRVLFRCGFVFVLTDLMLIFGEKHPGFNHLCAASMILTMGAIAEWIALLCEELSGGIPLLSHTWNIVLGRCLIALGAILCFA